MTELSQQARSIIEEARRADTPSAADRQRIREKLIARLGAGVLATGTVIGSSTGGAASSAGAAGSTGASGGLGSVSSAIGAAGTGTAVGLTTKIALVSAVVGAIGVGAVVTPWDQITNSSSKKTKPDADRSERPMSQKAISPKGEPFHPASDESVAKTKKKDTLPLPSNDGIRRPIRRDGTNTSGSTPDLKAELRLLRAAQVALQKGDSNRALSVLDKHRRKFPRGSLRQEREAARAVVLCELGRYDEGQRIAKRLLVNSPRSPLSRRVARSCTK